MCEHGRACSHTDLYKVMLLESTQNCAKPVLSEREVPGKPLLALGIWRNHRGSFTLRRTGFTKRETCDPALRCFAKWREKHIKHQGRRPQLVPYVRRCVWKLGCFLYTSWWSPLRERAEAAQMKSDKEKPRYTTIKKKKTTPKNQTVEKSNVTFFEQKFQEELREIRIR